MALWLLLFWKSTQTPLYFSALGRTAPGFPACPERDEICHLMTTLLCAQDCVLEKDRTESVMMCGSTRGVCVQRWLRFQLPGQRWVGIGMGAGRWFSLLLQLNVSTAPLAKSLLSLKHSRNFNLPPLRCQVPHYKPQISMDLYLVTPR